MPDTDTAIAPPSADAPPLRDGAPDLAPAESEPGELPSPRLVPVTEAIRYRKRAQTAEQQLDGVRKELDSVRQQLDQSRQAIDTLERRQKIDALLADADAVDFEVARLLTEAAVEAMDEPDVAEAIGDLRRAKPYLFRRRSSPEASAMPARSRHLAAGGATDAAETAATTGDRRDLLRYLRLRRAAS